MSNDNDNYWKSQGKMGKNPGERASEPEIILDSQVGTKVITEQEYFQMRGFFVPIQRTGYIIQDGNSVKTTVIYKMLDALGEELPISEFVDGEGGISLASGVPRPIPRKRKVTCESPFGLHEPWACIYGYDAQLTEKGNILCAVCLEKQRWNKIIRFCGGWVIDRPEIY